MTQREEFEAWVNRTYKSLAYLHLSPTSGKWETWQAAQSAQPAREEFDVRGKLAASLTCWHRLTETESSELAVLFAAQSAQPLREPEEASVWCRYVAGMVATYLNEDGDGDKAKAIASIIERRLKFFQAQPLRELSDEEIDQVANDGHRNAAGGIYATSVYDFARDVLAAARSAK